MAWMVSAVLGVERGALVASGARLEEEDHVVAGWVLGDGGGVVQAGAGPRRSRMISTHAGESKVVTSTTEVAETITCRHKEILAAIRDLEEAGWRVEIAGGRSPAYARAYCPGGAGGCPPLTIYGTPRVPENEAAKIRRALRRCEHAGEEGER